MPRAATFKPGDRVLFNDYALKRNADPDQTINADRKLHKVLTVEKVPDDSKTTAGHHQWITVSGRISTFSGCYFKRWRGGPAKIRK